MLKEVNRTRNHSCNYCQNSFLHTYAHVLTSYTAKEEKMLPTETFLNKPFQNCHILFIYLLFITALFKVGVQT